MMDPYRGTGRTTRMLYQAAQTAETGDWVYIVAANFNQATELMIQFQQRFVCQKIGPHKLRFLNCTISFGSVTEDMWDWDTQRFRGVLGPTFIDHYAWELRH